MYILVWSDQLDFSDMKEARWQLEGAEQPLDNNFDKTYTSQVVIDDNVKQLDPGEVVETSLQIQMEDNSGYQVQVEIDLSLEGPGPTGTLPDTSAAGILGSILALGPLSAGGYLLAIGVRNLRKREYRS